MLTPGIFWKVPGKWKWNLAGHPLQIKLKLFYIKNKRISTEMWSVWFVFFYQHVDKNGYAGILFLAKMYQFIV